MKRVWMGMVALLLVGAAAIAVADDQPGPGAAGAPGGGGGPGGGRGPIIMGGPSGPGGARGPGMPGGPPPHGPGPGMMGPRRGWEAWENNPQVPEGKRSKLHDLSVQAQAKAAALMPTIREKMQTLRTAMERFPVDKVGARKMWADLNALQKQTFEARLEATGKAQTLLGKDLWETLSSMPQRPGPGPGPGPGPQLQGQ